MGLFLFGNFRAKMARNTKVQKIGDAKLNECEQAIGFALMELESNSDLKAQLRELFIRSAQEIEIGKGKKAIVIFVPVPQLKAFQKIQVRLVRELEKKFAGKHVVFIAQRKILAKPTRKANKPFLTTWCTQQRLSESGLASVLTGQGSSKSTWTRFNRPALNTRPKPSPPYTRS